MSRIQEEEEERGPQTFLRPSTRFPPSISERLRNRHCRSPRGDREGVYLMQPSSKLERRMGCRVDRADPYNLPTTDKGKGMRTAYRTSEDGENTKKGETGGGVRRIGGKKTTELAKDGNGRTTVRTHNGECKARTCGNCGRWRQHSATPTSRVWDTEKKLSRVGATPYILQRSKEG